MPLKDSPLNYVYDIESTPNFFSCVIVHLHTGTRWIFEVSDWANHAPQFCEFMYALQVNGARLIGFNNFNYDWQVCEYILSIGPTFTAADAFAKTKMLIEGCGQCSMCQHGNSFRCQTNFKNMVWGSNQRVNQVDLYLIHHFNNFAKSTSLKEIEFNMRSRNIGDLPFAPGTPIDYDQRNLTLIYNCHDVSETGKFAEYSEPMIQFREDLIPTMGYDVMNYNDTKIGKKFFESELRSRAPHLLGSSKNKKQTRRDVIHFNDIILPWLDAEFETPQMQGLVRTLRNTSITKTKAPPELKEVSVTLEGFTMEVGVGGGHGSVERQCVRPPEGWKLIDVDVASYYPNLAIANRFYPAHLSETFCDIYEDVYNTRKSFPKKTAPNEMYKLALNGVYGDSGNEHSIFLDPQYMMSITINGQLLLYLLTEKILTHTNGKMIQLNTDGITFMVPEADEAMVKNICAWWEEKTKLELEFAYYEAMWIRDVNNYLAKTIEGKVKKIGAYASETQRENPATREVKWSKDHSALVVQKAAVAEMVEGVSVRQFILNHTDPYDFMLRQKGSKTVRLRTIGNGVEDPDPNNPTEGEWLQKLTRYHIAKAGQNLQKIHPPTKTAPEKFRKIGVHVGWHVAICDDMADFDPYNLEYEWYIAEADKLVIR